MGSPSAGAPNAGSKKAQSDVLKEQGNLRFEARAWSDAIKLYSKAIDLSPEEASYYGNRAAGYLMMKNYNKCVEDCKTAIGLKPEFTKAHTRLAKAYVEMGLFDHAVQHLQSVQGSNTAITSELQRCLDMAQWLEQGKGAYESGDYTLACTFFANILGKTEAVVAQLWLARSELGLGRTDQVLRRTRDLVKADMNNAKALAVRGRALYLTGDYDQAVKHLKQALTVDPDEIEASQPLKRIKRVRENAEKAKSAAFKRDFASAVELYTIAIDDSDSPKHAPLTALLYAERAKSSLRLKNFEACLKDCAVALYAQDDHVEAWLCKASALHALAKHQDALNDMTDLYRLYHSDEKVQAAYNRAQFEVRKEKRPDYYKLLGVGQKASESEIKVAYKAKALELHPDKQVGKSEAEIKEAESQFKMLGDILEILGDQQRRKLWDEGYDRAAIEERIKAGEKASREHKKDGCCGGGCH